MKKILLLLLVAGPVLLQAQVIKQLKKTISLKMPKTADDEMPGTRGAAVVWHPVQKKYYAAFAGNQAYPLAVFDASGKRLSADTLNCMVDTRGLWYNSKQKNICGNGYNETGWFSYTLNVKGIPNNADVYIEGMNQPADQSVGTYNAKADIVYFLHKQSIQVYNKEGMQEEDSTIRIYTGIGKQDEISEEDQEEELSENYNITTVVYTGIPKAEFGLLNSTEKQVELYNRKTGLMTQKLKLPSTVKTYTSFNFSYSNGTYWFFDQDTRTWTGYK
jgi:hypothetical protein